MWKEQLYTCFQIYIPTWSIQGDKALNIFHQKYLDRPHWPHLQAESMFDEFDDCCDLSYIVDGDIPRGYYDNNTPSDESWRIEHNRKNVFQTFYQISFFPM